MSKDQKVLFAILATCGKLRLMEISYQTCVDKDTMEEAVAIIINGKVTDVI